jgi:hypothetical protein
MGLESKKGSLACQRPERELAGSGIVARGNDATEAARALNLPGCWVDVPAGSNECNQVTGGISEVRMIEQLEVLNGKFESLRLRHFRKRTWRRVA